MKFRNYCDLPFIGLVYLCMKLFSFPNHKLNQWTILGEHIFVIGITIVTVLGSFKKAKYNAIFLAYQRVADTVQGEAFTLIHPL